ncbi:glycosyltransferase family 2 protein [Antrihabitans stalagmiti]|uniref:glycosyltransferase family 2 protein n=1 Tax=Antrihabitans stalagmiti TaxID=2799499 RepID=UPI0027DAB6A3|nr:glycosyltransferase family 2 protein [Antrihabitans stalagmiti]
MDTKCLSIVVPTYNEEDIIGECLERLTAQLEHIAEIVVVDNNSTDDTNSIVETFASRFAEVKMISEREQGLVFARNAGLDAATGPLIARIDSDTLVPPHWAKSIVEFFAGDTAGKWAAACGRGEAYGLPYGDRLGNFKRRYLGSNTNSAVREVPVLYGSNMILRRDVWHKIRDAVSMRRDIFEDVDTGLCVGESGGSIAFLPNITVGVSPRRMETRMSAFVVYMSFLPRTLLLHRRFGYAALATFVYLPALTVLHAGRLAVIRGYDPKSGSFSARNYRLATVDRINP